MFREILNQDERQYREKARACLDNIPGGYSTEEIQD